ncbi:hypothetical protein Tco_0839450 [Tanacetum coccineum]|uniref:Reverse transcriptase domain-containing protein n=1 Tax=Tanacetum coccineum TaxID=301880 RepID=A0ABQ5ARH7_9ASTR
MPMGPSSFDVILGIDQLSKYHAVIVRGEEIVRIPHGDEILIIQGSGQSQTGCFRTLCLSDESLVILLEAIQADDKLHFVEGAVVLWTDRYAVETKAAPHCHRTCDDGVWIRWKENDGKLMVDFSLDLRASIDNGISVQMFTTTFKGIQPNKDDRGRRRKDWVSYGGRSILFHPYAERIKELSCYTLEDDGGGLSRSKRAERGNILGRNSNKNQK